MKHRVSKNLMYLLSQLDSSLLLSRSNGLLPIKGKKQG